MITSKGFIVFAQENKSVVVKNFNEITVSNGIDLVLIQGNSEKLIITADAEIINNVIVEQTGNSIRIKMKDGFSFSNLFKGNSKAIKVKVNYKTLNALNTSGGSDVITQNQLKTDKFTIKSSGGSDVNLNIACRDLSIESSGGSDVDLKGTAENMQINSSGGSDIDAFGLVAQYARVNSSGGSDVNINVVKGLEAGASGGSDIRFKGEAALKKTSNSKSGDVKRVK
jgi:hypothetical protein